MASIFTIGFLVGLVVGICVWAVGYGIKYVLDNGDDEQ